MRKPTYGGEPSRPEVTTTDDGHGGGDDEFRGYEAIKEDADNEQPGDLIQSRCRAKEKRQERRDHDHWGEGERKDV